MPGPAFRRSSLLATLLIALVSLGGSQARAETKVVRGIKYETRSTPWHGGKKAEWEVRVTGKSGVTKIYGVSWGSKVRGTERTFKNGNKVERLTITAAPAEKQIQVGGYVRNGKQVRGYTRTIKTQDVRKVTTRTLKDGKVEKTIRMSDGSARRITSWTDKGMRLTETRELDKAGNVLSTKLSNVPVTN